MTPNPPSAAAYPKYAPPYPQAFYPFWPKHALRAGSLVAAVILALLALATYWQVPMDPNTPPLPDEGAYIPAPEWYLFLVFQPFWYATGDLARWLPLGTFWLPLLIFGLLLAVPLLLPRRRPAAGSVARQGPFLLVALGVWLMGTGAVVGSGAPAKTLGCPSCHNATMGERQNLPPADVGAYFLESRRQQIEVGRYNIGSEGHRGAEGGSYKDANWQLRHFYEPTMTW